MDFYQIRIADFKKMSHIHKKMDKLYNSLPETTGCLENICKENGCGAWCCQCQSPQLFYCEFLNIWSYISENFDDRQIFDIIERSLRNAVSEAVDKKCVFFDDITKKCLCHQVRGINCMFYGITPESEFEKRVEKVKQSNMDADICFIKSQCSLVRTSDGREVTEEDIERWWEEIQKVEMMFGVPKEQVNDSQGGSYRAPHDHVILYLMPENVLNGLNAIKSFPDMKDRYFHLDNIISKMKEAFGIE